MSPAERLEAAQRALSAERPASDARVRATEQRVLATLAQRRRSGARSLRLTLLAAALLALAGSTAWAAATGRLGLPRLRPGAGDARSTRTPRAAPASPASIAVPHAAPPLAAAPDVNAPLAVATAASAATPSAPVPGTSAPQAPSASAVTPSVPVTAEPGPPARAARARPVPAALLGSAPAPPGDDESGASAIYRRGHEAHFVRGDHLAALAAWDEYLRVAPHGRFAPEVRFNRALDLVRLGRRAEALAQLDALARGSYRAAEAARVRDALRDAPP
jgi:hypothetical protein